MSPKKDFLLLLKKTPNSIFIEIQALIVELMCYLEIIMGSEGPQIRRSLRLAISIQYNTKGSCFGSNSSSSYLIINSQASN